jgi:hypothetical protein
MPSEIGTTYPAGTPFTWFRLKTTARAAIKPRLISSVTANSDQNEPVAARPPMATCGLPRMNPSGSR